MHLGVPRRGLVDDLSHSVYGLVDTMDLLDAENLP